VENPVGAGWSYVDDLSLLPTNNSQIADDLVTLFTAFLTAYPVFQTVPFFVFCESYGGKMTTTFATALLAAIDAGKVKSNFRGVALGDSWISGIDFTDTWGTVLRTSALMEANELAPCSSLITAPRPPPPPPLQAQSRRHSRPRSAPPPPQPPPHLPGR
jgi:serine carboxypeptidase 1